MDNAVGDIRGGCKTLENGLESAYKSLNEGNTVATINFYGQPPRLYRYRALEHFEREIDAIVNGYVFCSAFTALNDPMEGLFSSSRRLRENEDYRAIRQSIVQNKSQIGMCSFSEVRNHELMWAHYADQFSGVCVSYSFSKLQRFLPDNVSFVRMFYDETEPIVHSTHIAHSDLAKMVLSYKNHRWLYEREWRMFAPEQGNVHYRDTACVTTVYLGSRISEAHRRGITDRLKESGIRTRCMSINKYSISFETNS